MSESGMPEQTNESWDKPSTTGVRSRPTRACAKCGRKFLTTFVVAHEGTCVAAAPVVAADGTKPKKPRKAKAAAKK